MASWSNKSNLALNPVQTKQMVLSTNQLARVHDLNNQTIQLEISNRQLERVSETKLLGVKLQENLKWNDHVKHVADASYGVLRTRRKLRHFTNVNFRKRRAELLVLSRLDYCDSVFSPLPRYLMKRLQKIEFAAASFVYGRYINNIGDIIFKAKLASCGRKKGFNLLKLTFKALHFQQSLCPTYLNLQRVSIVRELRSLGCIRLQVPLEKGTFQDTTASIFNNLPKELKICDNFNLFTSRLFKFLKKPCKGTPLEIFFF